MHDRHKEWIAGRGIDPVLAEKFGLSSTTSDGACWLTVPYIENGQVVNRKYRLTGDKRHKMDAGAPLALWNVDCLNEPEVQSGRAPVVITEGEWDALAAITAGIQYAVSVPNGAPAKVSDEPETATRYDWVQRHAEALGKVQTFILATDADQAGYNLAADLARLFGADRCKFIDYPFPCKDLNEVLVEYGPERVVHLVNTAKPYPVQGLYTMADFPERGEVRSYSVGVPVISDLVSIVPGTLTVVTGYANMGKSTLMNAVIGNALRYHFPVCIASFETEVKPILRDGLRMAILGCGKHDLAKVELSDADDIINSRLTIISQTVDEDMEMDLDKFLDLCRTAVMQHGVRMVVLDPWNELEHKRRRDENETEYISRALRAIKRFAKQYDVAFWIVAHPTKPQDGVKKVPGLYDISGSANWANKADYGLTYHRTHPTENEALIRVHKVRMGLPGSKGEVAVTYDFRTSTFEMRA